MPAESEERAMSVDYIAGVPITGRFYVPSCGGCDVPPWESCACSSHMRPQSERNANGEQALGVAEQLNAEADERLQLALAL